MRGINDEAQDLPTSFFEVAADQRLKAQLNKPLAVVRDNINQFVTDVKELFRKLKFKISQAFSVEDLKRLPLSDLEPSLRFGQMQTEKLSNGLDYVLGSKSYRRWDGTVGNSS